MYNDFTKGILKSISINDGAIESNQKLYVILDNFSHVELYIGNKISFRVKGDAYLTAMIKWVATAIQDKKNIHNITLEELVNKFAIPEYKIRNAVQIIELIEKIDER